MAAVIYGIFFPAARLVYVGSSLEPSPVPRWAAHLRRLRKGSHPTKKLQAAFKQHGEAAIAWRVLERIPDGVDVQGVSDIEQRWVDRYAAMGVLLNTNQKINPYWGALPKHRVEPHPCVSQGMRVNDKGTAA